MSLTETIRRLSIDYQPIDQDHAEFINLLAQLDNSSNADFPVLFQALYIHTVEHFERENQLMQQSAFPAFREHISEHQRVLSEFQQFQSRIDMGLIAFGRGFIKQRLPTWFVLHVSTMDSALAAHIKSTGLPLK
ncbi:MAG: hemerythrin [Methylomonas lenta]|nr:hemerythrin [Methylomonas lenta]